MQKRNAIKKGIACRLSCRFKNAESIIFNKFYVLITAIGNRCNGKE
jgi:hypothetical protein